MEDPEREIQGIIRALVDRPTCRRQEQTLRKYWAPDCVFTHIYSNVKGLENLIALYQAAHTFVHYQKDGRLLKRIKVQRDYFQRSPVFVTMPLIGDIYGSPKIRWFIGWAQAISFRAFKAALFAVLPVSFVAALGF